MSNKTLQHELGRVKNMTDDQLWIRYGKMTKPEKIKSFLHALTMTDRNEKLQMTITKDHHIAVEKRWYIQKSDIGWSFYTYDDGNIQIKRYVRQANKRIWDEKPYSAKYANGFYPTHQARVFWDDKIAEGYSKTEMLTDE